MDTLLSLIIGLVLGVVFVIWDHKKGQKWYKRWFDLTHKERLPEGTDVTFIRNQPFSKRLVPAVLITGIFMYATWWLGSLNPLVTHAPWCYRLGGSVGWFLHRTVYRQKTAKRFGKSE